ncbi:uncharacterized protein [Haliotis cracherodii]
MKVPRHRSMVCLGFGVSLFAVVAYVLNINQSKFARKVQPMLMTQYEFNATANPPTLQNEKCPNVTKGMMRGKWRPRKLTRTEQSEIDGFLARARKVHGILSLQRNDSKCWNISLSNKWFRALCNPNGPTPCCHGTTCVKKTVDECKCPNCYDHRHSVHAEYSTWEPEDSRCLVKNFTAQKACDLLQGLTITFVGDSLLRHIYTGFLLLLSNNPFDGAIKTDAPKDIRKQCEGMDMFTEKNCRIWLKRYTFVCNNSNYIEMRDTYKAKDVGNFRGVAKQMINKQNTIIVLSIGLHDQLNSKRVLQDFIMPVFRLKEKEKSSWPKLIWSTIHSRSHLIFRKDIHDHFKKTKEFNDIMTTHMIRHGVPVFDTFNMTHGVVSPDGTHYGSGINIMKAQMLLNFLQEIKSSKLKN